MQRLDRAVPGRQAPVIAHRAWLVVGDGAGEGEGRRGGGARGERLGGWADRGGRGQLERRFLAGQRVGGGGRGGGGRAGHHEDGIAAAGVGRRDDGVRGRRLRPGAGEGEGGRRRHVAVGQRPVVGDGLRLLAGDRAGGGEVGERRPAGDALGRGLHGRRGGDAAVRG